MKFKKIFIICYITFFIFLLTSCDLLGTKNTELKTNNKSSLVSSKNNSSSEIKTTKLNRFKEDYDFKYFNNDNKVSTEIINDGVTLVKNEIHKTNGNLVVIYAVEVDLNKVDIVAGTNNNESTTFNYTKATPYSMATTFENQTNRKVFASINADFFGSTTVNAFVKDGFIIKNAHTTSGVYDYLDDRSDLPASAPMLFGVKDETAQVAPIRSYSGDITSSDVKRTVATSKLSYRFHLLDTTINSSASLNFTTDSITLEEGYVYAIIDLSNGVDNLKVISVDVLDSKTTLKSLDNNTGYLYAYSTNSSEFNFVNNLKENDIISFEVKSATNTWNGYKTILGCRQALIIDSSIPLTVALENTNGAKNSEVPRSAVGIKEDGTVVIFSVESLYYGSKGKENDSHGLSLVELAEFMQYYNIVDGANFDGGGSTQLIVREDNTFNRVVVRSSDTGSNVASETRKVMNSLLVVEKEK